MGQSLKSFIKENKIKADVTYGSNTTHEGMENMNPWTVVLKMDGRKMTVPFFTGYAITDAPTAEDVLDCLASDAAGYETASSFEDWANEYGYDEDSRKAEKIFKAVEKQTEKLRRFMGEKYNTLLWDCERL